MACALFVNLVKWKIWKRRTRVWWTKITIIYNSRDVYQTKDIQSWSENLKRRSSLSHREEFLIAIDVVTVKNNSSGVPLSLSLWLPWHQFELDVWSWLLASFRVRDRNYLGVGFIFRISEATLMVLRGWLRFEPTSVQLKTFNSFVDFSQGQNCWGL